MPRGPEDALTAMASYRNGRACSMYGGSNEVQRGIIAKAVLGLGRRRKEIEDEFFAER